MSRPIPAKADLLPGMVAVLRNGVHCMVVNTAMPTPYLLSADKTFSVPLTAYDSRLRVDRTGPHDYDIMELYGFVRGGTHLSVAKALSVSADGRPLLWARSQPVELTLEEIANKLGCEVHIVARY